MYVVNLSQSFFNSRTKSEIQEVIHILSPLVEIVTTIKGENSKSIGPIFPFLRTYSKFIYAEDSQESSQWKIPTTPVAQKIRESFKSSFALYWKAIPSVGIGLSTLLDPRYKTMKIFDENETAYLHNELIKSMDTLQKTFKQEVTNSQEILNTYLLHENLINNRDSLGWWKKNHTKFEELTYFFKMYYCIPCISGRKEFLISDSPNPMFVNIYNLCDDLAESYIMIRNNQIFV